MTGKVRMTDQVKIRSMQNPKHRFELLHPLILVPFEAGAGRAILRFELAHHGMVAEGS